MLIKYLFLSFGKIENSFLQIDYEYKNKLLKIISKTKYYE